MDQTKYRTADDPKESLLFCTIRIAAKNSQGAISLGTGFFFSFAESEDSVVPTIVTNKHVLDGAVSVHLTFRHSATDLSGPLPGEGFSVEILDLQDSVIPHPDPAIDLCLIPLARLIAAMNKRGQYPWFGMLDNESVDKKVLNYPLHAIENVFMVGYPTGLWDEVNNMPIVRRGITATHASLDWQGRPEFLIDAACYPGSSGSPVFLFRTSPLNAPLPGGFGIKHDCILLGILYAGPVYTATGEIRVREVPTSSAHFSTTSIPVNLGVIIKAEKLFDFESLIKQRIAENVFRDQAHRVRRAVNEDAQHVPSFLKPPR